MVIVFNHKLCTVNSYKMWFFRLPGFSYPIKCCMRQAAWLQINIEPYHNFPHAHIRQTDRQAHAIYHHRIYEYVFVFEFMNMYVSMSTLGSCCMIKIAIKWERKRGNRFHIKFLHRLIIINDESRFVNPLTPSLAISQCLNPFWLHTIHITLSFSIYSIFQTLKCIQTRNGKQRKIMNFNMKNYHTQNRCLSCSVIYY